MKNVVIQPVALKEIPQLSAIAKQAYTDHYTSIWHDEGEWYKETMYNEAQLTNELNDKNAPYYLVFQDNKLYGFIKLKLDYPLSIGKSGLPFGYGEGSNVQLHTALYIDRIYFVKEATGKGIGRFCFDFIEKLAFSLGKNALWLMSMDSSPALLFYEKQGFNTCGTWHLDFDLMKEACRGMVIMYKKL